MSKKQLEAIKKDLHPRAEHLAKEYIDDFAVSLVLLAKILAFRERADIVLSSHIRQARRIIDNQHGRSSFRDVLLIIGSALFGAFVPGFISELLETRTLFGLVPVVFGFLGVLLVFWGLRR